MELPVSSSMVTLTPLTGENPEVWPSAGVLRPNSEADSGETATAETDGAGAGARPDSSCLPVLHQPYHRLWPPSEKASRQNLREYYCLMD